MSSDVQSTRVAASGAIYAGPGRVKALNIIAGASAGSVVIKDGGASGTTVLTIDTPAAAAGWMYLELPGNGIRCSTDIYATITNAAACTVVYA